MLSRSNDRLSDGFSCIGGYIPVSIHAGLLFHNRWQAVLSATAVCHAHYIGLYVHSDAHPDAHPGIARSENHCCFYVLRQLTAVGVRLL